MGPRCLSRGMPSRSLRYKNSTRIYAAPASIQHIILAGFEVQLPVGLAGPPKHLPWDSLQDHLGQDNLLWMTDLWNGWAELRETRHVLCWRCVLVGKVALVLS